MGAPASPPHDDRARTGAPPPSGADDVVRAVMAGLIELLRALREEIARVQDGAEAFVGRVKGALVRSLDALRRAIMDTFLALLFLTLGAIVLSIFLVALLNQLLGDPWGTGLTALLLLVAALAFGLRAKANFRAMEREASTLARRGKI